MTFTDFMNVIEIQEDEIEKAMYYCELKGIDLHYSIFEYLSSMKSGKVKYSEIATTYRYDKRIRKVLYKFIGLFEEYIRAYISNKYSEQLELVTWTKPIMNRMCEGLKLSNALDDIAFGELVNQVILLSEEDRLHLFRYTNYNEQNLKAIVELRNAVSHNRFLLNYLKFKDCMINNEKRSSLYANLLNLSFHLNPEIRKQFIKELDECNFPDDGKQTENVKNQTFWDLAKDIVIKISIEDTVYKPVEGGIYKTNTDN